MLLIPSYCRGAPLSEGWIDHKGGHSRLVCPYHGWAFDGQGTLQDVPVREWREAARQPDIHACRAVASAWLLLPFLTHHRAPCSALVCSALPCRQLPTRASGPSGR